ncbi:MAG: 6-carboxytetrahydropterin synthase QueD [Chloroflexi bacterium]|nr:6-carboxytetrahydropterin synthase QueD [Chloroflexota bacterium]
MYEVEITQHFDAAHCLRGYQGRCENLHGHRWQVAVGLETDKLDDLGLAFDFTSLKAILKDVIGQYDHTNLNDLPPFTTINPTAENIARVIYEQCEAQLHEKQATLRYVKVWESPDARAIYRR